LCNLLVNLIGIQFFAAIIYLNVFLKALAGQAGLYLYNGCVFKPSHLDLVVGHFYELERWEHSQHVGRRSLGFETQPFTVASYSTLLLNIFANAAFCIYKLFNKVHYPKSYFSFFLFFEASHWLGVLDNKQQRKHIRHAGSVLILLRARYNALCASSYTYNGFSW